MPTSTQCFYKGRNIDVSRAIQLNSQYPKNHPDKPEFRCISCRELVKPHREGGLGGAHFEHYARNPNCKLSHKLRGNNMGNQTYEIEDVRAWEGYKHDSHLLRTARNQKIAQACKKRDNYTCQACGFSLRVHGRYVIECHHIDPLAVTGSRLVSLNDLVALCPTCHRIAHTSARPLQVSEIKALHNKGQ